jgi:hypothetical protein
MPMVLLRCIKRIDLANLQRRLGPGMAFDDYRPAGSYTLLISKKGDRDVLARLRKMKADGKFNGCDCKFVFKPGMLKLMTLRRPHAEINVYLSAERGSPRLCIPLFAPPHPH